MYTGFTKSSVVRKCRQIILMTAVLLASIVALAQSQGDVIRVGINVFPKDLDPTFDTTAGVQGIYTQIFEPLVAVDATGQPVPALAESWTQVDDLTWRFQIRQGVPFHDGHLLTAADVKFTLERVLDPATAAPWKPRIEVIQSVEVLGTYELEIRTSRPFVMLPKNLATILILPEHGVTAGDFSAAPVGTGPFRFVRWQRDATIELAVFDAYWGEHPSIRTLTYRYMPEASTRVSALQAREVDLVYDVPSDLVGRMESAGFKIAAVPVGYSMVVELKSTLGGPLTNKLVRQAVNYAVDKESIVDELFGGYARLLQGQLVGSDGFGFDPTLSAYPYDPARARELLAEAGYEDGFEVDLEVAPGQYPRDRELSEIIAAQLADVGIRVNIIALERAVRSQRVFDGVIGPMFMISWQYLPAMDVALPYDFHTSTSAWNLIKEPEFDRLLERQAAQFDSAERLETLHELGAWFRDFAPVLFLYQTVSVYGYDAGLEGLILNADLTVDYTNAAWQD